VPPIAYLADKRIVLPDGTTRDLSLVRSGLACGTWEVTALSRDGRRVAYQTVLMRTRSGAKIAVDAVSEPGDVVVPGVRTVDLATGTDTLVAEGACNPAWSESGALAYVKGVAAGGTEGDPYLGRVVVRSVDGRESVWTADAARYEIAGWAGGRLLLYRFVRFESELLVIDPVTGLRSLAADASVIALAPDGSRALVSTMPTLPLNDSERATLRLLRLVDGVELSSLRLDPEIENLSSSGSWRGDRIVATVGLFPGGISHPGPELFTISVAGNRIAIVEELVFESPLVGPGPFATITEPFFKDASHVGALWWFAGMRYLECDLTAHRCSLSADLADRSQLLR
jgi:hypothetical protein